MMAFFQLSITCFIFLSSLPVYAEINGKDSLPANTKFNGKDSLGIDPLVKTGRLSNGLTYYIRENKRPEKKVELRLVLKVGSIVEDENQLGLAHMAEHMAFNGTKHYKKNDIVSFLQDIGVGFGSDLNAYTGFDETVYILPIPTDKPGNLEKGFQVLEDWAHLVTYNDDDINNERAVILEESRMGKDAEERMFKKVYPELFEGSKYADRLPIGSDSIIRNFSPPLIRKFYDEWYRPDLMAVIVVGDISSATAMSLINKHFSGLKNPPSERKREYATVPPFAAEKAMVVTDKEATSYNFSLNYPHYTVDPVSTVDDYRDMLIKSLYSGMMNNRFRETSQKENAPFVYAYAGFESYAKGYESFNISASSGTNDIMKSVDAVAEEIERVKRYGFTKAELDRSRKNMLSSYERSWNNRDKNESQNYAEEYVGNFTDQEPAPGIQKEFEYVKQLLPGITIEEVNHLTDSYKNVKNRFAYITGPLSSPSYKLPADKEIIAVIDAKAGMAVLPYEEKQISSSLISTSITPGKIIAVSKNNLLGTTECKLSNGITVVLKITDFKDDQILINVGRYGGINGYGVADKYSAENASGIISTMGIGGFSPTDLRKVLAGKSVSVSPYISDIKEGFRGNSGNKDIETMFQLIYLYATAPRKDSSLFSSYIQQRKAQFKMLDANPQYAFYDTINRVLYNNSPLAPTTVPKPENYDKISLSRVFQIYQERLGDMSGMKVNIVGSFKEKDILPLIEKYIASLPSSGKKITYTDNRLREVKGKVDFRFYKGKEEKSEIVQIYGSEYPYNPQTALSFSVLSEILNIKIIEEMREKIQGIYGGSTYSTTEKAPYPSYQFSVELPCGPAKVDTLLKAFKKELEMISTKGPAQSYLDKVKIQLLEGFRTDMKTNEFWLAKLTQLQYEEIYVDRFIHWDKYVQQLKLSDIQSAAKIIRNSPTQFVAVKMPERK